MKIPKGDPKDIKDRRGRNNPNRGKGATGAGRGATSNKQSVVGRVSGTKRKGT